MGTSTDTYSSARTCRFTERLERNEEAERIERYDRAAEKLLASSPWASARMVFEQEEDPFPLLRPSSRPPGEMHGRASRAHRRKRAEALAALIAVPFVLLAAYAIVATIWA